MNRVLRPGGMLILETPDYSTLGWQIIEPVYGFLMPGGYKDEHITHYSLEKLSEILPRFGFAIEETSYIARSDLMLRCRKVDAVAVGAGDTTAAITERASSAA